MEKRMMLTDKQVDWVEGSYRGKHFKRSTFGMYVRYQRLMNHISTIELGRTCGISATHIQLIERGARTTPGAHIVYKLCKALNIDGNTLMELLEGEYETS